MEPIEEVEKTEEERQPVHKVYPTLTQSWGIGGIFVLCSFAAYPITIWEKIVNINGLMILFGYLFSTISTLFISCLFCKKINKTISFSWSVQNFQAIPLIILASIALFFGFITPVRLLIPFPDFFRESIFFSMDGWSVSSFILIAFAAPIMEELIFRGIMLDGLLRKYSPVEAIVFSSIIFGIVHLNPWQFITAFTIGAFAGWIYYHTRSLPLAIVTHMAVNLIAITITTINLEALYYINDYLILLGGLANTLLITGSSFLIALICIWLLQKEFRKKRLSVEEEVHPDNLPR